MIKNPFIITKTYCTKLTIEEINNIFEKKINTQSFYQRYTGKYNDKSFKIYAYLMGFSVKVNGEIIKTEHGFDINVIYKPLYNPFFIILPLFLFLICALFVKNFTINGESATMLQRVMFSLAVLGGFSFIIYLLTTNPIDKVQSSFEKELGQSN